MGDLKLQQSRTSEAADGLDVESKTSIAGRLNSQDVQELASIGKRPVLNRGFGFLSLLGFSCSLMGTWAGMLVSFVVNLTNGGPGGSVYGFIICWIGIASIMACLAELISMAPTSGGQYHFVAMLAPKRHQKLLSFIAGWFTVAAWQAGFASVLYPTATMIQGVWALNHPGYEIKSWHGVLVCYALLTVAVIINTANNQYLAKLEGFILVVFFVGFAATMIPLLFLAEHGSASSVFMDFENGGGWPTQGLSFFVGLSAFAFAFGGADGVLHMSEEVVSASKVVPRAMMGTVLINGVLGFGMLLAILFSLGNLEDALESPTGFPFMEVFQAAAGVRGSTIMASIVICLGTASSFGALATCSRQLWAFARDNGLPGSKLLAKVEPRRALPLYAIGLTVFINALLPLLSLGTESAFTSFISLQVTNWYCSFMMPCYLLLWRRIRGDISIQIDMTDLSDYHRNTPLASHLMWGYWRMPASFGLFVNVVACSFGTIILFFSFWPQATPTTPDTMNYSTLMTGATMLFGLLYYAVTGRKTYKGPLIEV